jgi:hypothetical protein
MTQWEDRPTNNGTSPFSLEAQDEDYDVYLFWPSLSSGMESSGMSFVGAQRRVIISNLVSYKPHRYALQPIPPLFDHIGYYSDWDTVPSVCHTPVLSRPAELSWSTVTTPLDITIGFSLSHTMRRSDH